MRPRILRVHSGRADDMTMTDSGAQSGISLTRSRMDGGGAAPETFRRILDAAAVPAATLDGEGQIVSLNPAFARLCGRGQSEVAGLHLLSLCPGRDQADVLSKLVRIVGGVSDVEQEKLRVTGADGRVRTLSVTLGGIAGADGRVERIVAVGADLTEERRAQRHLRRESIERAREALADHDTGFPNERALSVLTGSAMRRAGLHQSSFALLRCEVVDPRSLAATHGDDAAREAIAAVAERLQQRLRSEDTVTRSAPEVFTVIAEDLGDVQDAVGVAYRLLASVVEPVLTSSGSAIPIELVIGISVGDGCSTPERLLSDAAQAAGEALTDGSGGFRVIDSRTASPA